MTDLTTESYQRIKRLKEQSKLLQLMNLFCKKVGLHREAVLEAGKPKKQEQLAKMADTIYPIQPLFFTPYHEFLSTWILQGTDKSIPYLISFAAEFSTTLDLFKLSFDSVKQNQQLFQHLKETFPEKSNEILTLLLDDLELLNQSYNLNLDKKEIVDAFKKEKENYRDKLKKQFLDNKKIDTKILNKF